MIRDLEGLDGFGYFSSKHFFREELASLNKKLQKKLCNKPALVPVMPWIDAQAPGKPMALRVEGETLVWDVPETKDAMDCSRFFAIYRYEAGDNTLIKSVENLVQLTGESHATFENGIPAGIYRVSGLDRLNNESQLSEPMEVE